MVTIKTKKELLSACNANLDTSAPLQLQQDVNHRVLQSRSTAQVLLVMLLMAIIIRVRRLIVLLEHTATKTELDSYQIACRVLQATIAQLLLLAAAKKLFNALRHTIVWEVFTIITLHSHVPRVSIALQEQTCQFLALSVATAQAHSRLHLQATATQDITAHSRKRPLLN